MKRKLEVSLKSIKEMNLGCPLSLLLISISLLAFASFSFGVILMTTLFFLEHVLL